MNQAANQTPNLEELQAEVIKLRQTISKKQFQEKALRSLNEELTTKLDLGEAVDTVNKYLWEMINYSSAVYIVFNVAEGRFESRAYVKQGISQQYLASIKQQLIDFIHLNSDKSLLGAVTAVIKIDPLMFGLPLDEDGAQHPKSQLVIPLNMGGKIIGALSISSIENDIYTEEDRDLITTFLTSAAVSISRIQTVVQSLNSRTEALVQSLSNGVIMFDHEKQVTLANPSATRFTGLPKEGYDLSELSKLFSQLDLNKIINSALEKGKISYIAKAALAQFFYEIFIVPVKDHQDKVIGGAVILHDITHIVKVDQAKTEFVSLASHQLRTPLTSIKWYTESILDGDAGELNQEQKESLEVISKSNERMIELVNALLNVSRLELGTFSVEPEMTDLVDIAQSVVVELQHQVDTKQQNLVQNYQADLPKLNVDPKLTRIIIQNLLSNAVKYTPEKGEIQISLTKFTPDPQAQSDYPESVLLMVKDNGLGIPLNQQDKIFSKLFRADNVKTTNTEGTGLGLYIIKSIVDHSGGKIEFESAENQGTTFRVYIPLTGMKKKSGSKSLS